MFPVEMHYLRQWTAGIAAGAHVLAARDRAGGVGSARVFSKDRGRCPGVPAGHAGDPPVARVPARVHPARIDLEIHALYGDLDLARAAAGAGSAACRAAQADSRDEYRRDQSHDSWRAAWSSMPGSSAARCSILRPGWRGWRPYASRRHLRRNARVGPAARRQAVRGGFGARARSPRCRRRHHRRSRNADLAPMVLELAAVGGRDPRELQWLDVPPAASWRRRATCCGSLEAIDNAGKVTRWAGPWPAQDCIRALHTCWCAPAGLQMNRWQPAGRIAVRARPAARRVGSGPAHAPGNAAR